MRWHFFVTPPADGADNMALDEALMRRAGRTGDAVFRLYGWSAPTLSLGRNQRARDCYDHARARDLGVAFVRRPTGGRALLHFHEVTYSVTMPSPHASQARAAYDFINDLLLGGLRRLGVGAARATSPVGGALSLPPGPRPCFDVPAEREIEVAGRKLVGSAQWRHDSCLLQHGSILVHDDQALIARLLVSGDADPPGAATLSDALGREPAFEEVALAMRASLVETLEAVHDFQHEAAVADDARAARATYEDSSWTWRR